MTTDDTGQTENAAAIAEPEPTATLESTADVEAQHARNTELLHAELPDPRFVDSSYLRWLYDQNPAGEGVHAHGDEDGRRMAHYGLIPQRYRCASGPALMMFSLNAVTRSGGQRRGWFTTLGEQVYARAAARGAVGVIGVSNENSTPPVVRKLGFRLLGPLPVRVVPATVRPSRDTEHLPAERALAAGSAFDAVVGHLDGQPAGAWTQSWTPGALRWRLSAPNMASPYWVHISEAMVAVTARTRLAGVPVAVVLKLLERADGGSVDDAARRASQARALIGDACRYHRAPGAVYAGYNRRIRVGGLAPPRRLLPAPLNLIYRSLDPVAPNETFAVDCFEFLDMDAY
jgi:hypothetical protein